MIRPRGGSPLKHALLDRLMHYYRYVQMQTGGREDIVQGEAPVEGFVSSAQLAVWTHSDDTLVRKDLAAIGVRGCPRVGYKARDILRVVRQTLGFDDVHRAVLVGAGRLGGALASYGGFAHYGLKIIALFDSDLEREGDIIGGNMVQRLENLESVVTRHGVRLAILTVPAEEAQALADRLVQAGIVAIWNFASTRLSVPSHVVVRHELIFVGLAELAYHLKINNTPARPPKP